MAPISTSRPAGSRRATPIPVVLRRSPPMSTRCCWPPAGDPSGCGADGPSRRPLLGADQLARDQALGDLDRVQRRALAQIVGDAPQREAVLDGRVLAHAADIGRV